MNLSRLRQHLRDYRFYCLSLALVAMLALFVRPEAMQHRPVYHFTFIIDITRSMNARDYLLQDEALSRLDYIKQVLQAVVTKLPCQSKVGLGVFTERKTTLLFQPIEVCSSWGEIESTIKAIDWRMAWAADSRIAKGIADIIQQKQTIPDEHSHIIFFTDGQEAPPINPRYKTDFSDIKTTFKGMLVGVGGLQNVPIPKYDSQGRQQGVYQPDDVPQRSTFGLPPTSSVPVDGYNARNAPFGRAKARGDQHLTRLYEPYLQQLSKDLDWSYLRLESAEQLSGALLIPRFAEKKRVWVDMRRYPAGIALLLLSAVYMRRWKIRVPAKSLSTIHQQRDEL